MRTYQAVAMIALCLGAAACDSEGDKGAPGATPGATGKGASPAAGTKVGDLPLTVDLPAGAVANDGAPGFHSEDKSVSVIVKAAGDADPKDLDGAKKAAEEMLFKKWVKSEKTADGWVLSYLGTGIDMEGKEYENNVFSVRRKLGDASYDCYGSVKKAADVDKNIKLCQAMKASP
jgi:hypothetical protein